jgi:hypothetical protein
VDRRRVPGRQARRSYGAMAAGSTTVETARAPPQIRVEEIVGKS